MKDNRRKDKHSFIVFHDNMIAFLMNFFVNMLFVRSFPNNMQKKIRHYWLRFTWLTCS